MDNTIEEKIDIMEKELAKMKATLNKSKTSLDLSEFVGKSGDYMCIFGKNKMLKVWKDEIWFNIYNRDAYNEPLTYTHTTLSELKEGDIFISEGRLENVKIDEFNIFIGKDIKGKYWIQFISNNYNIEYIESTYYDNDEEKIIIIN